MTIAARTRGSAPAVAALGILGALAASGCQNSFQGPSDGTRELIHAVEKEPWADPTRVLVEVNGIPLTQGQFYHRVLEQFGTRRFLAGVITQEIVRQEAEHAGIQATEAEVEHRVDAVLAEEARQAGGRAALERQYQELGMTLADARTEHTKDARTQILITKLVKSQRRVDDDALRTYYKVTYATTRYATRHVAYGFRPKEGETEADIPRLKLEAHNKAARAVDRLRKGADFAELARAESEDSVTASHGGDLGPIQDDPKVVPEFMRVIFKLAANEISDPVENPQGGYHVFQVTAILPGQSFVDVKEKMREEILNREPTVDEITRALDTMRKRAAVTFPGESPVHNAAAAARPPAASPASPDGSANGAGAPAAASSAPPTSTAPARERP
ncbi:MAG TPA: peptidylprolyl isomerase [Planctomycetota bacterium]|nr:peptidylprolyl isomerase [Planctomycetota bacterium]